MAKIDLAKLVVTLEAQNAKYISQLEKAEQRADKWEAKTKKAVGSVKNLMGGLAAGITLVTFTALVRNTQLVIDQQAKLADNLGFTTEQFKALELQARLDGVEMNALQSGLTRFLKSLSDARDGLSEPIRQLEKLGLTVKDLDGLSSFEALDLVSKRFGNLSDEVERSGVVLALFGRSGLGIKKLLENVDSTGLQTMVERAESLGVAVTRVDAAKVEAANDALELTKEAGRGLATTLAVELAPALEGISNWFTTIITKANNGLTTAFNVTKYLAEEIAALMGGAAIGDLPRLYSQLAEAQDELVKKQREMRAGILFFGPSQEDVDAAAAQVAKLQEMIRLSEEFAANRASRPPAPVIDPGEDDGTDSKAVKAADIIAKLEEQIALYGKTGQAAQLSYQLARGQIEGVTQAEIEHIAALEAGITALDEWKKLSEELSAQEQKRVDAQKQALEAVEALRVQSMTAEEQRASQLIDMYEQLQTAVNMGQISQAEANTIYQRLEQQAKDAETKISDLEEYAKEAARNIHNSLADFFFDPISEGFDGLLKKALGVLRRIAAETAATFVEDKVKGWLQGFSGGTGVMGAISKFAGFFDSGGHIPAGQWGIAAEKRDEIASLGGRGFFLPGPADITGGAATAAAMAGGSGDVDVTIVNNGAPMAVRSKTVSRNGDKTAVELVVETVNAALRNGELDDTLGAAFGLSRARGSVG